ncbi:MAG: lipocalin-like domain-containing protein [Promethearchaeota archaeon]
MKKEYNVGPMIKEAWTGPGNKDGTITVFKPEHDGLHIDMKKKGNAEWWYFDARLEDGHFVVGFFRAKHERTGKTGVEITIYKPDGTKIQKIYDYTRSDLTATSKDANVKIGNNYIKVDFSNSKLPEYEIFLDEGEYGIHLKYKATVQSWMPGKGYTEFGDLGHFGWCIALPRADVEGTIKVEGKTIPAKGIGYHDHNWLNFNLVRVVEYWYWGRIYSDNFTLIYAYIKCNKKMNDHGIKVMMLAKGETILLSTGESDIIAEDFQFHEYVNNHYPKILKFNISEKQKVKLEVQEIIDADNLLFELGPVLRFIVKNILKLKPGYFRLKSKFNVNIQHNGEIYKEEGNTLHEMVIAK